MRKALAVSNHSESWVKYRVQTLYQIMWNSVVELAGNVAPIGLVLTGSVPITSLVDIVQRSLEVWASIRCLSHSAR